MFLERYTKALEAIKKHRKEQSRLVNECKLNLENLQNLKDHAHQVRESRRILRTCITCICDLKEPDSFFVLFWKVQRDLKMKIDFQKQANEEILIIQKEIENHEKLLHDLKQQQNAMNAVITDIKQLRAVHVQMIAENQKAYADLKQEFEGCRDLRGSVFILC